MEQGKIQNSTFFQGCSGVSPVSHSSECFWKLFFQSEFVRSLLYLSSAITLTALVEGESGNLSHALALFLLPHMVGSKSRSLQNEHL